jgi:two-component system cell cycle sensor histidine kinase/response regulator CckA
MRDQKDYMDLLGRFLRGDREEALGGVADLARELAASKASPEALLSMHARSINKAVETLDRAGAERAESAASELLVRGMSSFAAHLRDIADRLEHEKKKAEWEQALLLVELENRKEAEKQIRQAVKWDALGILAGGIAHAFNNMLAIIMGNAELALDEAEDNTGIRHNLGQIFDAAKRGRDLIRHILALTLKTGQCTKVLHLGALLEELFKSLHNSVPSTIDMRLSIYEGPDMVQGDPYYLRHLLFSLCTNAIQSMNHAEGKLEVSLTEGNIPLSAPADGIKPGRCLVLTVKDTGGGIDRETQELIFDPFFTTREPGQGFGMGLAVAYAIVRAHRGTITVDSEPGKGSVFTVFLPRYEEAAEPK